jgi:hypothetical protein
VEPYISLEEFTPEAVSKVSRACTSICMWVRAMHLYHTVALSVAPKRQALAAAQATLDKTLAELAAAQVGGGGAVACAGLTSRPAARGPAGLRFLRR